MFFLLPRVRTQQLDAKRRKLKESLESKESGDSSCVSVQKAKRSLQETIKKLQAEGLSPIGKIFPKF